MTLTDGGYRFTNWFLLYWSRTTLPLAVVLALLSPLVYRASGLATLLIFLHLPVYLIHQYEEHAEGQFHAFVNQTIGRGREALTLTDIFWINILGVWGVNCAALYAAFYCGAGYGLTAVYLTLLNGIIHLMTTVRLRRYNPGLWTGAGIFIPYGAFSLWRISMEADVSAAQHYVGLGLAALLHLFILAIVLRHMTRRR